MGGRVSDVLRTTNYRSSNGSFWNERGEGHVDAAVRILGSNVCGWNDAAKKKIVDLLLWGEMKTNPEQPEGALS